MSRPRIGALGARLAGGVDAVDARLGDAIERSVKLKHRLRLARRGQLHVLEPGAGPWAQGAPPPRAGCAMDVLVDGQVAFAAMAQAIREARESIWVAGWFITPGFELVRDGDCQSVGALLADAAARGVDVRVLVWAGSPIPLFQPNRRQAKATVAALSAVPGLRCEADPHEHPLHCHHEKTLVLDRRLAFVGGIDMTDLKNDRYDTTEHPSRLRTGWHDVAAALRGPVVADVAAHFAQRWRELTGEVLDLGQPPSPAGPHTVQMVRTVAETMYKDLPEGEFSILESYVRALRDAEHYVYLENQFLWAPEITDLLAAKLASPPREDFRVVILLPSRAHAGQDDTLGQLGVLEAADGGGRLLVVTPRSMSGQRQDQLYVHAKLAIVDDRWLTVGSANLNAHSLLNDTEVNVVSDSPELARDTRLALWAEHLGMAVSELAGRPASEIVDTCWAPIALGQRERAQRDEPPTRRVVALSGASRRSRRLLGPLNGLLADA